MRDKNMRGNALFSLYSSYSVELNASPSEIMTQYRAYEDLNAQVSE
jgi:hypothetical protein